MVKEVKPVPKDLIDPIIWDRDIPDYIKHGKEKYYIDDFTTGIICDKAGNLLGSFHALYPTDHGLYIGVDGNGEKAARVTDMALIGTPNHCIGVFFPLDKFQINEIDHTIKPRGDLFDFAIPDGVEITEF